MPSDIPIFTLRLPPQLMNKLRRLSEINKRSANKEIEYILETFIRKYEFENGSLEEDKIETIAASKFGDKTENLPENVLKEIEIAKQKYRNEFR